MFQQIMQTLGNMDGQYQAKTPVTCFITDVKDVEYSKKTGKPGQSLYLRHIPTGEIAWVKLNLVGDTKPLTSADKGTERDFLVWPYKPPESPKIYLYCWIQRQTTPQTPQNAHGGTNSGQGKIAGQEMLEVLYEILAAIKDLQPFEKKYNLNEDNPSEQVADDSDQIPF